MCENIDKIFDPNVLVEFRKANGGKRVRIDSVAKFLGIGKDEIDKIKNNKRMKSKYRNALEESSVIYNGKNIYDQFLERISEWEKNDKWGPLDIIGYFCYMYEKTNNVDFIFKKCKNPFKTKETKMAADLMNIFKNKEHVKKYIDWAFNAKNRGSFKICGISVLLSSWLMNEFNIYMLKCKKISRTTILPETFLSWCKLNIPEIFELHELKTYGHLNTMIGMIKNGTKDKVVYKAVEKAKEMNIIKEM